MELPIRKIVFDHNNPGQFGLLAVSEVLDPAIQENFVLFSEDYKLQLAIQDKTKRTVFGPILVPGMKVYRNHPKFGEFYLTADEQTIESIVVDFFANGRTNNVNQDHKNELVDGFTFYQSVITNDLIPTIKGWEHLPKGTAFLGAYVNDDAKLKEIEDGTFKGWSIHGLFDQQPIEMSNQLLESVLFNLLKK